MNMFLYDNINKSLFYPQSLFPISFYVQGAGKCHLYLIILEMSQGTKQGNSILVYKATVSSLFLIMIVFQFLIMTVFQFLIMMVIQFLIMTVFQFLIMIVFQFLMMIVFQFLIMIVFQFLIMTVFQLVMLHSIY